MWRDELRDEMDDRLRAALVVEPPPELRLRLAALARASAAERRVELAGGRGTLGWLADATTWLTAAVLALALWQAYALLAASTLVLGDVVDAAALLAALPALPSLGSLGVDPLSLALWCVVGVIAWLVAEGAPTRGPHPGEPRP